MAPKIRFYSGKIFWVTSVGEHSVLCQFQEEVCRKDNSHQEDSESCLHRVRITANKDVGNKMSTRVSRSVRNTSIMVTMIRPDRGYM